MEITPRLREALKAPLGRVVKDASQISGDAVLVAVGDSASDALLNAGLKPRMLVYDGRTARHEIGVSKAIKGHKAEEHRVKNPPGHLEEDVFRLFRRLLAKRTLSKVFVDGEEDLTTLAAIKEASLGTVVVYGQPGEGMVVVTVDQEIKDKVKDILEEMEDGC